MARVSISPVRGGSVPGRASRKPWWARSPATLVLPSELERVRFLAIVASSPIVFGGAVFL